MEMKHSAMARKYLAILLLVGPLAACNGGMSIDRGAQTFSEGVGDAAATPLEDLNVRRDEIPAVLTEAVEHPYGLAGLGRCSQISAEVSRLDEALGPDLDDPQRMSGERMDDVAAGAALDVVRDTVTDFIPMRSWVRRLSGAEQHSRRVQQSIQAGLVRRSFLKGVGLQRNCRPPAAPMGVRPLR
jgi:hypothetical protein